MKKEWSFAKRQIHSPCYPVEGKTNEDSKEVQTETLELTATPLPNGLVKVKTGANTTDAVYNAWYNSVYESPGEDNSGEG